MKLRKGILLMLTGALLFGATACSKKDNANETAAVEEISSALEILENVWNTYSDDEQFPAAGGSYDNGVMGAPGALDVTNAETLETMLYLPQEDASKIDDAALLMHMMNANTFTAGSYHLAEGTTQEDFAKLLEESLQDVQWMCGFPDKLVIASVGDDYMVSAFGNEELIDTFKEKLLAEYKSAAVLYDEAIE